MRKYKHKIQAIELICWLIILCVVSSAAIQTVAQL
jgi:hypothetical protein